MEIPEELTDPTVVREREVKDLKDVGLVLADYVEGLERANLDKRLIRCIVDNNEECEDAI